MLRSQGELAAVHAQRPVERPLLDVVPNAAVDAAARWEHRDAARRYIGAHLLGGVGSSTAPEQHILAPAQRRWRAAAQAAYAATLRAHELEQIPLAVVQRAPTERERARRLITFPGAARCRVNHGVRTARPYCSLKVCRFEESGRAGERESERATVR